MTYASFAGDSRYNDDTSWFRPDHAHNLTLGGPFIWTQSLRVDVQGHPRGCMTQQLLHDFDILTICLEDRRKGVAKGTLKYCSHHILDRKDSMWQ